MTIYLHAISALPALYDVGGPFTPDPVASLRDSSARIREGDRIDLRLQRLGVQERPVHVLVDSARKMTRNRLAISHCSPGSLARNSFTEVSEGILASTPELCFLQFSAILDLVDTIRLGYELCGSYILDAQSPGGFIETDPLTSPARIASFIESVSDVAGIRRARQAIKWVRGSSRSPRETALSMMLLLPSRYGGWQLGHHVLNHEVDVGVDVEGSMRRFVDVYWPEAKVGLEYDSDLFHFDPKRMVSDSVREKVLLNKGIRMLRITNAELSDPLKREFAFEVIAKTLGIRLRNKSAEVRARRRLLAERLLVQKPLF